MNAFVFLARRGIPGLVAVLLLLAFAGALPASAAAALTVDTTADAVDVSPGDGVCATAGGACTLRAAVQEANALPGADTVILPVGSYLLSLAGAGEDSAVTGDLDITDDLTISGAAASTTAIDGVSLDRVLQVAAGVTVEMSGVTIRNGKAAGPFPPPENFFGGGIFNSGTLTVIHSIITGNKALQGGGAGVLNETTLIISESTIDANAAGTQGGGILNVTGATATITSSVIDSNTVKIGGGGGVENFGTLTVTGSGVTGNKSSDSGGGINNRWGSATLTDLEISGNLAGIGGGLAVAEDSAATLESTAVSGNSATSFGAGGINNRGNLTILGSTIAANSAAYDGGGVWNSQFATLSVTGSTISANNAAFNGAGIRNNGSATVTNSTISGNSAGGVGGGIWSAWLGTTFALIGSTVANNLASSNGAGIMNGSGSAMDIQGSTISGNETAKSGGGIYSMGSLEIRESLLSGNTSYEQGGGIHAENTLTIANSTISGNRAVSQPGGGVLLTSYITATFTNVTIADNAALVGGGLSSAGYPAVSNSLFADNRSTSLPGWTSDCQGTLTSAGHNLIENVSGCTIGGDTTGDITGQDPVLWPLANNGGSTQTQALGYGSAAIDAGNPVGCPQSDQRGVARPKGTACDIGAYEFDPAAPPPLGIQGDVNCDFNLTAVDALGVLRHVAGLSQLAQREPCADIGAAVSWGVQGDVNCGNGAITAVDALGILRSIAGLSQNPQKEPCPDIGSNVW